MVSSSPANRLSANSCLTDQAHIVPVRLTQLLLESVCFLTHQQQQPIPTTRFGSDNESSIWILFHAPTTKVFNLDADTCANLSAYLTRIHDEYAAFQNTGQTEDLACETNILERLFVQQPEVTEHFCCGSPCYHIGNNARAALRDVCETLRRKMNRVAALSFPLGFENGGDVYSIYRRHGIQYPEEPGHLSDPEGLDCHYQSVADLQQEVLSAQRWCIFNNFSCDLLATQLDTANSTSFDVLQVRGSKVVRQAHNWYVRLQNALDAYQVPS